MIESLFSVIEYYNFNVVELINKPDSDLLDVEIYSNDVIVLMKQLGVFSRCYLLGSYNKMVRLLALRARWDSVFEVRVFDFLDWFSCVAARVPV